MKIDLQMIIMNIKKLRIDCFNTYTDGELRISKSELFKSFRSGSKQSKFTEFLKDKPA